MARYGARALQCDPGFALVAVLTLGLGIGANTAIFSALDAVLLRPLPFADPDRLVRLAIDMPWALGGEPRENWTPDITDARALDDVFTHVAAYAAGGLNLTGAGAPRRIRVGVVTARRTAGGKDVSLSGGAKAAQQHLTAGLVDEIEINLVPTLLGSGERLFEGIGDRLHGLELVRTVATPRVIHLKFEKQRNS